MSSATTTTSSSGSAFLVDASAFLGDYSTSVTFTGDRGQEILRIERDGTVTFPAGLAPDETAAEIWAAFTAIGALDAKPCKPINADALVSFALIFAFAFMAGFAWSRRS